MVIYDFAATLLKKRAIIALLSALNMLTAKYPLFRTAHKFMALNKLLWPHSKFEYMLVFIKTTNFIRNMPTKCVCPSQGRHFLEEDMVVHIFLSHNQVIFFKPTRSKIDPNRAIALT